jgi:hypothetical protein
VVACLRCGDQAFVVRHEWQASRHNGFDEFEVVEFLKQTGAAQTALIDSLFLIPADA